MYGIVKQEQKFTQTDNVMTTYTLLGIDHFVNTRTAKRRFKPQYGLTDEQLNRIRKREKACLLSQFPDEDKNNIDILLLYKEENN